MIRFIYDPKTPEFTANASGNVLDVVEEIAICMNIAYNLIRSRDPEAAHQFESAMCTIFRPDSPVWDAEDVPDPENGVKLVRVKETKKEGDPT